MEWELQDTCLVIFTPHEYGDDEQRSVRYHRILSILQQDNDLLSMKWRNGKEVVEELLLSSSTDAIKEITSWMHASRVTHPMQLDCCTRDPNESGASSRRICLVVNPSSGQGAGMSVATKLRALLSSATDRMVTIELELVTEKPGDALAYVRDTQSFEGIDAIVCVGGDGTLYEVLNGMMRREHPIHESMMLGIVPSGSGNGLAVSLGIDSVEEAALRVIHGCQRPLDLMRVTNPAFEGIPIYSFLQVSFGQMCDVDFDTEWLRWMGDFRFVLGICYSLLLYVAYPATITYNRGEDEGIRKDYVMAGGFNTRYLSADFQGGPRAKIDNGFIDMMVLPHAMGRVKFLSIVNAMQTGAQCAINECQYYKVTGFSIETPSTGRYDIDGECVYASGRLDIECMPSHCLLLA